MKLYIFVFILAFAECMAQVTFERSVINSTGANFNGGGISVSYSIGEAVTGTVLCTEINLIQGFIQPPEKIKVSVEFADLSLKISVLPNPVSDLLVVEVENSGEFDSWLPIVEISGLDGRVLQSTNLSGRFNSLDFSGFASGIYYLTIQYRLISQTVKIVKM